MELLKLPDGLGTSCRKASGAGVSGLARPLILCCLSYTTLAQLNLIQRPLLLLRPTHSQRAFTHLRQAGVGRVLVWPYLSYFLLHSLHLPRCLSVRACMSMVFLLLPSSNCVSFQAEWTCARTCRSVDGSPCNTCLLRDLYRDVANFFCFQPMLLRYALSYCGGSSLSFRYGHFTTSTRAFSVRREGERWRALRFLGPPLLRSRSWRLNSRLRLRRRPPPASSARRMSLRMLSMFIKRNIIICFCCVHFTDPKECDGYNITNDEEYPPCAVQGVQTPRWTA